jgi:hypothetical protein
VQQCLSNQLETLYNPKIQTPNARQVRTIDFKDGSSISFDYPEDRWGNVFWGEMHHESLGVQVRLDSHLFSQHKFWSNRTLLFHGCATASCYRNCILKPKFRQTFTDEKNKIRCRISFGNPEGKRGLPSDYFEGVIERCLSSPRPLSRRDSSSMTTLEC